MTDTEVFINGKPAGEMHQGGFYRFSYDITDLLKPGKKNLLEVKIAKESANKSINAAERKADWWLYGGIYRPVWLEVVPAVHMRHFVLNADRSRTGIPNSRPFPARYADRAQGTFFERALEGMEQGTCRLTRRIFPFIWVGQYATGLYHK